jgi:antitoxin component YwqK of YwqJK toxin-antitoxin module
MPVKNIPLIILSFFYTLNCCAQDTIEKKEKLTDHVTEKFEVLKDNEQIKNGPYQALYKRKTPVAMGIYTKGKKTGLWRFYDPKGELMQIYNYDADSLRFEAKEYSTSSDFWYLIDKDIADTDKVSKPVKAGGRYYGYLPYLGLYKIPFNPYQYGTPDCVAVIELLISPLGRLADYKVRAVCSLLQYDQTIHMNTNLFKEEDRKFIPATYNGKPVLSRIIIKCRVNTGGGLDFY